MSSFRSTRLEAVNALQAFKFNKFKLADLYSSIFIIVSIKSGGEHNLPQMHEIPKQQRKLVKAMMEHHDDYLLPRT